MTNRRMSGPWIIASVTTITLSTAACSTHVAETAATTYAASKPPVDNYSYEKTGATPALPLPTGPATPAEPAPEVTVTVTATPTIDTRTGLPQVLEIPSFGVVSDVIAVGKDATGGVAVPDDIHTTGWYDRSAWIGAPQGSRSWSATEIRRSTGPAHCMESRNSRSATPLS